ncbi:hypothetical protein LLH23_16865 [bacterium]|nr:hypothetical protein [bacterium]
MSLAVALEGADGIVLAADSRGTIGDPRGLTAINDLQVKLFRLTRFAGVCTYGSGELGAEVCHQLQRVVSAVDEGNQSVDGLEAAVRQTARKLYDDWFEKYPPPNRPTLGLLLGGVTSAGTARAVLFPSELDFAPHPAVTGFMAGGVPQYATYLVHRFYDKSKPVTALASLAEYIINETASQDPKVGGAVKIALITADRGYEELSPQAVENIRCRNESASSALRESFYRTGGDNSGL